MDRISNSLIDLFPDLVGNDANSPDSDWRIWGGSRVTAKSFERLMPILRRALFKTLEAVLNRLLAHLSLLAGFATREAAPGLHRGQKVCPTRAMF